MNRPWMPFYIADYLADTGHLSTLEHGAYLLLIFHYWQNGGVPDEDARLARIARVTAKEWKAMRPTLAAFFDPTWKHPRIERDLADSNARYERRAAAGREGGNAKAMLVRGGSNARPMPRQKAGNVGDSRGGRDNHHHNPSGSPAEQDKVGLGTCQGGRAHPGGPDDAPFGCDGEAAR